MGSMDFDAGRDAAITVRHRCKKCHTNPSFMETCAKKLSFRRTQRVNRVPVHHGDAQPLADAHGPTWGGTNIGSAESQNGHAASLSSVPSVCRGCA